MDSLFYCKAACSRRFMYVFLTKNVAGSGRCVVVGAWTVQYRATRRHEVGRLEQVQCALPASVHGATVQRFAYCAVSLP